MTSLWDQSALDVLRQTASRAPTPGGGSVAALSGAFGVALVSMALEISLSKRPAESDLQAMQDLLGQLTAHRERLQVLADGDVAAFGGYVRASNLPKGSEDERQRRRDALREATRTATDTPLDIAQTAVDALRLAPRAADLAHKEVVSDVGAGVALLRGALQAGLLTVDINLPGWPEEERPRLRDRRGALEAEGISLAEDVLRRTRERIGEEG